MSEPAYKLTRAQDRATDLLIGPAMYIALGGGSRSGKTFLLMRAVIIRALKAPDSRHAVFRFRFNSVKHYIVADTLPKVEMPNRDNFIDVWATQGEKPW